MLKYSIPVSVTTAMWVARSFVQTTRYRPDMNALIYRIEISNVYRRFKYRCQGEFLTLPFHEFHPNAKRWNHLCGCDIRNDPRRAFSGSREVVAVREVKRDFCSMGEIGIRGEGGEGSWRSPLPSVFDDLNSPTTRHNRLSPIPSVFEQTCLIMGDPEYFPSQSYEMKWEAAFQPTERAWRTGKVLQYDKEISSLGQNESESSRELVKSRLMFDYKAIPGTSS